MNVSRGGLFCLLILFVAVVNANAEEGDFIAETDQTPDLPRYVVFPGLDADSEELAEWNMGFASPFNVFFGPKPYVLGWVGETAFGPPGEEEEVEEGEGDYEDEEGEEGEGIEEEEGVEGEEVDSNYDYEKL